MKKFTIFMITLLFVGFTFAQQQSNENALTRKATSPVITNNVELPAVVHNAPKDGNATIILKAGDVWGDGSGYQMLLDADATAFGVEIPAEGPLAQGDAPAGLYDAFEYKIPENADGSTSTSNIVINNEISIEVPAGTYDYCITNPTPGSVLWIAGGENARKDDYVFEAGKTYQFEAQMDAAGQGDEIIITIDGGSSSIEANALTSLKVYPNPANDVVRIENAENETIQVVNMIGKVMTTIPNGSANQTINVSNYAAGIYFVRVGNNVVKINVVK